MGDFLVWAWPHVWPGWDAVWPNILAAGICAALAWAWARRKVRHLHQRLDDLHARHDDHAAKLDALHAHLGVGVSDDVPEKGGA
jgi:hypothetical protein